MSRSSRAQSSQARSSQARSSQARSSQARSSYSIGGRHELGQNFLNHRSTIDRICRLVAELDGPILELGAGEGALTASLARLGRPLTALEIDPNRVRRLRRRLPGVRIEQADVLQYPLDAGVIVGNVPFGLTTPILRRLLGSDGWQAAVLLVQWEVARKRAGVGGGTMLTAQSAPWCEFRLIERVPARHFTPAPSVDGGVLLVRRRGSPLIDPADRKAYERFVRAVFTGRGNTLSKIIAGATKLSPGRARSALLEAGARPNQLARDLGPQQWASLWRTLHQPRR